MNNCMLTSDELEALAKDPRGWYYLLSWLLGSSHARGNIMFSDTLGALANIDWSDIDNDYETFERRYNDYETCEHRYNATPPEGPIQLIRLAFSLGYLEEAMRCKAFLEQHGLWHD